jgi:hypothetical protein
MFSRRTRARIVFLVDILLLPVHMYQWRAAEERNSDLFVPRWLFAGVGFQVAYSRAYDQDLGSIRTKRWRRFFLGIPWAILYRQLVPRSEAIRRNFSTGESIGRTGYRLWFGVLHPLPDTDK